MGRRGRKMVGWIELAGVIFAAVIGAEAGRSFSRLKNRYWCMGYLLPLALIFLLLYISLAGLNAFNPVFAWISSGRLRFVIIALSVTMGAMTLIGRLTNRIEKSVVFLIMVGVVGWGAVLPFALPLIVKNNLAKLPTITDADNICFQSTPYTCGPAAAVTALRQLGFQAHEGELAILSHTSPIIGTMPWDLYKAIEDRYAANGVDCRFRQFDSIKQMREADVTLAVVRDAFMLDHCVAILDITDKTLTIGDPILGKIQMSYKDFQSIWRFYGITLKYHPT
jgi:predicted double-glycine peptidase